MKKIILIFVSGVFYTSLITGYATAQNVTDLSFNAFKVDNATNWNSSDNSAKSTEIDPSSKFTLKEMKANLKASKINTKITNHINTEYKNISGFSLSPSNNLSIARFKMNDKLVKVVYDKNGNWSYTLLTYHENQMTQNIKSLINSNYREYTISLVQEIQQNEATSFMVYLNNNYNFKHVLILKDEIIKEETYNKRL